MAIQREVEVGKTLDNMSSAERKEHFRARLASVTERGLINDRLHVDLPDSVHGEWVNADPAEVAMYESLGFTVDTEYAKKRALHEETGSVRVGDVIHMTCPKELIEVINENKQKKFIEMHGDPKASIRTKLTEDATTDFGSPDITMESTSSEKTRSLSDLMKET